MSQKEENEITITMTEADGEWSVFCSSPVFTTKLKKIGAEPYKVNEDGSAFYKLNKKQISFRKLSENSGNRGWTEERKQKQVKIMQEARKKKNKTKED